MKDITAQKALMDAAGFFRIYAHDQLSSIRFIRSKKREEECRLLAEIWTQAAEELDEWAEQVK